MSAEKQDAPKDQTPSSDAATTELTQGDLNTVTGGLNPQPLPPKLPEE
jgi:hypothetical protein